MDSLTEETRSVIKVKESSKIFIFEDLVLYYYFSSSNHREKQRADVSCRFLSTQEPRCKKEWWHGRNEEERNISIYNNRQSEK